MTTNIAEFFNAWLREERHQTIYTLLLMHMDKLVAMLDTHMRGTDKWKSVVGPIIEEKLMSNITRSAPITVMPYLGGMFKVFTGEVYLVVDMQQYKCTCLTWQMFGLPCPHVCVMICTLRHDVYDYIDPCFKVSPNSWFTRVSFNHYQHTTCLKFVRLGLCKMAKATYFLVSNPRKWDVLQEDPNKGVLSHNLAIRELFIALNAMT